MNPEKNILTVSQLNHQIKGEIEPRFEDCWIQGEVSNWKLATSGHAYFVLKDKDSTLSATFFSYSRRKAAFEMKDGLQIIAHGSVTVYPPRGSYQLNIDQVEPLGAGALQLAFEQLKAKLQGEGLFDPARKRPLPKFPKKIVVITSAQAAALRDVLTVLKRRAPQIEVVIIPCLVQGAEAAAKLVQAIKIANHHKMGELILLTRGGGSLEDLWSFNHEDLARAIVASELPVISAVGHEVDFSISDFVADLRAPTPSAGAEILSQNWVRLAETSKQLSSRLATAMNKEILMMKRALQGMAARLRSPKDKLREQIQKADEMAARLERAMKQILERRRMGLTGAIGKLEALSPLKILSRGFALVTSGDRVVKTGKDVKVGSALQLQLENDQLHVKVESILLGAKPGGPPNVQ